MRAAADEIASQPCRLLRAGTRLEQCVRRPASHASTSTARSADLCNWAVNRAAPSWAAARLRRTTGSAAGCVSCPSTIESAEILDRHLLTRHRQRTQRRSAHSRCLRRARNVQHTAARREPLRIRSDGHRRPTGRSKLLAPLITAAGWTYAVRGMHTASASINCQIGGGWLAGAGSVTGLSSTEVASSAQGSDRRSAHFLLVRPQV